MFSSAGTWAARNASSPSASGPIATSGTRAAHPTRSAARSRRLRVALAPASTRRAARETLVDAALDQLAERPRGSAPLVGANLGHARGQLVDRPGDFPRELEPAASLLREAALEQARVELQPAERVVELVRDLDGEATEGRAHGATEAGAAALLRHDERRTSRIRDAGEDGGGRARHQESGAERLEQRAVPCCTACRQRRRDAHPDLLRNDRRADAVSRAFPNRPSHAIARPLRDQKEHREPGGPSLQRAHESEAIRRAETESEQRHVEPTPWEQRDGRVRAMLDGH